MASEDGGGRDLRGLRARLQPPVPADVQPLPCRSRRLHRTLGTVVIVERKTNWRLAARLPESPEELWDNVRCQLWCYGCIDDWSDAPEIRLAVQYWTRHRGGACTLAGDPFWWIHGNRPDFEPRCHEFFKEYCRHLERRIA